MAAYVFFWPKTKRRGLFQDLGPVEDIGIVGICPHLLLADTLTGYRGVLVIVGRA